MGILDFIFKPSPVPKSKTSGKNPQVFDKRKEYELLAEYKKYRGQHNASEYYAALPLIAFYYKYRNLDERYLESCIRACELCISLLDAKGMRKAIRSGMTIPAFRQLIIIYENRQEYEKAYAVVEKALKYSCHEEHDYYLRKKAKIEKKWQRPMNLCQTTE